MLKLSFELPESSKFQAPQLKLVANKREHPWAPALVLLEGFLCACGLRQLPLSSAPGHRPGGSTLRRGELKDVGHTMQCCALGHI